MTLLIRLVAILALSLGFSPIQAESNERFIKDIEQMRDVYLKAVNGNKRDVRRAIKQANALAKKYPRHPLVLVYKGCTLAQRGRDIGARPMDRMRDTEQGLNYIDRGLRMLAAGEYHYLATAEAQLLATFLFVHLPDSVFHRLKQGAHLVEQLLKHPRFEEMPEGMRAGIYLAAAVSAEKYEKLDQQRYYLELSLEANPGGVNSEEARTMLETLTN